MDRNVSEDGGLAMGIYAADASAHIHAEPGYIGGKSRSEKQCYTGDITIL